MLEGPSFVPSAAKRAIVFLHGYGSDGADLISLAPIVEEKLPEKLQQTFGYFSPNALETTVFGMGYQWFSDADWTFKDRQGIAKASRKLREYIKEVVVRKSGIPWENVVILGFSQGCMTSLFAIPRWEEKIAGLIGCSGILMWEDELEDEKYNKPKTILMHGKQDDVVDPANTPKTAKKLKAMGFDVEHHMVDGLGHGLNEESIDLIVTFIKELF